MDCSGGKITYILEGVPSPKNFRERDPSENYGNCNGGKPDKIKTFLSQRNYLEKINMSLILGKVLLLNAKLLKRMMLKNIVLQ